MDGMTGTAAAGFFAAHEAHLRRALETIRSRAYWSAYPEAPSGKIYGETAKADAEAAYAALLDKPFALPGHPGGGQVGHEVSPYGPALGVTYPKAAPATLIAAAKQAGVSWAAASIEQRMGVCLEILHRLNRQSFLIANTVMHTSGQAFVMAFQAGGPHAQDRALEALAYAYDAMTSIPGSAVWSKPAGRDQMLTLEKQFRIVPRGVALVIGCATFPTWNSYPAIFADLATGNPVIVKPHPGAILPLALTVRIGRDVLSEAGFDPNALLLAADDSAAPITKVLAAYPSIALIDFTGGPEFGHWLKANTTAQLYTEEAGVNPVVIADTAQLKAMCANIAFSLSLYSGQMCTAPQNIFIPKNGIATDEGDKSFHEVAAGIASAIDKLLSDPERAAGVLGAIQGEATLQRVKANAHGRIIRAAGHPPIPGHDGARTASPLLIAVEANDPRWRSEAFGPIAFVIETADTAHSIALAEDSTREKGAITSALYAVDEAAIEAMADAMARSGVALSVNLTGGIFVNQSAAFSDYHVSGANPAGNACLTDSAFVANRFRVATMRRLAA